MPGVFQEARRFVVVATPKMNRNSDAAKAYHTGLCAHTPGAHIRGLGVIGNMPGKGTSRFAGSNPAAPFRCINITDIERR